MVRKFRAPKWKRSLCQQHGCRKRIEGRSPLCREHLAVRLANNETTKDHIKIAEYIKSHTEFNIKKEL